MIERWALRLARLLDFNDSIPDEFEGLSVGLRLLGVERLREGQLDAVAAALRGESVLVVRPTGSGKTLCFQLPALLKPGTAFVLSPLKALMSDQVAGLQRRKLPGTFINGDLGPDEKTLRYELLEAGALKFLYCTPERFNPERVREAEVIRICAHQPSFLVVDEAHCVDRWGDDFRPDYAEIAAIRERLGDPPVLAFTATAGDKAQKRILKSLGLPGETPRLVTGADRPNIALIRHEIAGDVRSRSQVQERARLIKRLLDGVRSGKTMIFVPTVRIGDALRNALKQEGVDLPFYHSKLGTANERDLIIGRFTGRLDPALDAVICTNAFGMGIDVPNVRLVINWQHPSSVEDYLQEFGRAGRDGKPATAILLTDNGQERGLLDFMAKQTTDKLDAAIAAKVTARRVEQIDDISKIVTARGRCFRTQLTAYLDGPGSGPRRSLAWRLLERIFGSRHHVSKTRICCDACHPARSVEVMMGKVPS
jgi:ATP-dependent DNA helicase RecQ